MNSDDLDRFADERLDGLIEDAAWAALEERHGNALAIALHQARERRAAVAMLPRPALPDAVRTRALPPAPAPLRFPWRVMASVAIAACLVVLVLPRMSVSEPVPSGPGRAEPVQARERQTAHGTEGLAHRADDAPAAPAAFAAPPAPVVSGEDQVLAELSAAARTNAAGGSIAADAVAAEAPGPHAIALAWAPQRRDAARSERLDPELRQPSPKRAEHGPEQAAELRDQRAPAAALAAPAEATDTQVDATTKADGTVGTSVAAATTTAPDAMVVVLHNRTVSPWTIAADQMRIEAYDANGAVIWNGRVDAIGTLTVVPGGFLSLTVERADWPRTARTVRAMLGELVSAELALEPRPPE